MKTKILIIEDERAIADNIEYALIREGFETAWKSNAREGIKYLQKEEPGLLILDIGLPDKSGFELLKDIRKFSDIPVIILTARSDEIDRIVGFEIGADDYVVKPFSPRELASRVRAILKRSLRGSQQKPQTQTSPEKLPFEIDNKKQAIYFFSKRLILSRYEYRLLELLIQHPGWVFSRDKIMEMAWQEPDVSFDRTIDAHIKTIRGKLKEIRTDIDPIITHRGVGYSLRDDW